MFVHNCIKKMTTVNTPPISYVVSICMIKLYFIGKIDKTDWNVKEIERKIEENKVSAKHIKNGTEKVPKWSRPQFDDKVFIS